MKQLAAAIGLAACLGTQAMMLVPAYANPSFNSISSERHVSDEEKLERLLLRSDLNEKDLPDLKEKIEETNSTVEGMKCKGEFFRIGEYLISRTSCDQKNLAYILFKTGENAKDAIFLKGFYDFDGNKNFKQLYDLKDRKLPDWIKHAPMQDNYTKINK